MSRRKSSYYDDYMDTGESASRANRRSLRSYKDLDYFQDDEATSHPRRSAATAGGGSKRSRHDDPIYSVDGTAYNVSSTARVDRGRKRRSSFNVYGGPRSGMQRPRIIEEIIEVCSKFDETFQSNIYF